MSTTMLLVLLEVLGVVVLGPLWSWDGRWARRLSSLGDDDDETDDDLEDKGDEDETIENA